MYGITTYWHKRIVRAGKNTFLPYADNPPDLFIGDDDILFVDLGPVFEQWEADFGRTFVIGPNLLSSKCGKMWNQPEASAPGKSSGHSRTRRGDLVLQSPDRIHISDFFQAVRHVFSLWTLLGTQYGTDIEKSKQKNLCGCLLAKHHEGLRSTIRRLATANYKSRERARGKERISLWLFGPIPSVSSPFSVSA